MPLGKCILWEFATWGKFTSSSSDVLWFLQISDSENNLGLWVVNVLFFFCPNASFFILAICIGPSYPLDPSFHSTFGSSISTIFGFSYCCRLHWAPFYVKSALLFFQIAVTPRGLCPLHACRLVCSALRDHRALSAPPAPQAGPPPPRQLEVSSCVVPWASQTCAAWGQCRENHFPIRFVPFSNCL